jgi:hypothetical protein
MEPHKVESGGVSFKSVSCGRNFTAAVTGMTIMVFDKDCSPVHSGQMLGMSTLSVGGASGQAFTKNRPIVWAMLKSAQGRSQRSRPLFLHGLPPTLTLLFQRMWVSPPGCSILRIKDVQCTSKLPRCSCNVYRVLTPIPLLTAPLAERLRVVCADHHIGEPFSTHDLALSFFF